MKLIEKYINGRINQFIYKFYLLIILKLLITFFIIFLLIIYKKALFIDNLDINEKYSKIKMHLNLTFNEEIKFKIKIGIYAYCIQNGGRARMTSILINYFYKIKIFKIYLFTRTNKEENEYKIPENIKRNCVKNNIIKIIKRNKIDILIYQLNYYEEISILNKLKNLNIIFYQHSSFFYELYSNYTSFLSLYKEYQNSKYIVSIIRLESDYLFKKWGINSILMNNFVTYEYNKVIPSSLSSNIILMIGRGNNKFKRFELGIHSMEYIIKDIEDCSMKIISNLNGTYNLQNIVNNLNLEQNIKFNGYTLTPEIQFKNASLHIFPTISESFGLVLCETKIFGIPNILVGLDYVSIAKGGTRIIYDETSESIAKEAIKILQNKNYRKFLGKKAKNSMKKFNNELLFNNWIKLILCVYNGEKYYEELKTNNKKMNENEALIILKNQINLMKIRNSKYINITLNEFKNFTKMEEFLNMEKYI